MRKASILATVLVLSGCSRNPEPASEATGGADTAMSDPTMTAGDSTQVMGDSSLVNQEGNARPDQQTVEGDTVMGDSTLVGQEGDTGTPGDSAMMRGDSTMGGPAAPVEEAVPTDSAQGQRP